jgi:hypothetical protein
MVDFGALGGKAMKRRFSTVHACIATVTVLASWFLALPLQVNAQNTCPTPSQGQNAVYNPTCNNGPVVGSSSFIDASMFAVSTDTICSTIYKILNSVTYTAAVIDARGLPGATGASMTCKAGTTPWNNGATFVNVASTILLPATPTAGATPRPIIISTPWVLPANTHLIGEGDGISDASFTPGTTIQAASSFSGSMIQFGPLTCLPQPGVPSFCSGISVERLTLDGNGQSVNGITNALGIGPSYVDHVSLYRILGTGLSVSGSAVNSGPYTNITFDLGGVSGTQQTVCASINGLAGTRGIHGLNCIAENHDPPAAVLLDSSNNSLEDIRIVGFYDGIRVGANASAQSNILLNIVGDTGRGGLQPPVNVVHLSKNNPVSDLSMMGVSNVLGNPSISEYSIQDDVTSTTLGDVYVGIYALGESAGNGAYTRYTTSPNAPTWALGTASPSGSCARGSLYSCNDASCSAALWACSTPSGQTYTWTAIK